MVEISNTGINTTQLSNVLQVFIEQIRSTNREIEKFCEKVKKLNKYQETSSTSEQQNGKKSKIVVGELATSTKQGITTGLNQFYESPPKELNPLKAFLDGDITFNKLIKNVFYSMRAQWQQKLISLFSDGITNTLMGILTPSINTIDPSNIIKSIFNKMTSSATEMGKSLNLKIIEPLIGGVKSIFSSLGFSSSGWLGSLINLFFAEGGLVKGVGTTTSDSIPAWLSDGEFVTRASVVKQPGMLAYLHDINSRGISAVNDYAKRISHSTGGIAGIPSALANTSFKGVSFSENNSKATTVENAVNLHVYDDPQRIISSSFSDVGMENYYLKIERNPQRLKSILGV